MAAAYGAMSPIYQQGSILFKKYYPTPINHPELGELEILYTEKIPRGQLSDRLSFLDIIKQPLDTTYTKIGEGVSGDVYLLDFGEKYVLKSIPLLGVVYIQYIKHEIEILLNLIGNPYAVQLLGSIIKYNPRYFNNNADLIGKLKTGTAYLLYPYIPGMTLETYQKKLEEHQKIHGADTTESREMIDIYDKIIDAVESLHKTGILHSDIKPDNIWIPDDRTKPPFLLDFGLSQTLFSKDGPVNYTRNVGARGFWSHQRMLDTQRNYKMYPMSKGINWIALAKTFGYNDKFIYNKEEYKYETGQSPLNRNGRFKKLANAYNKNERPLTYKHLKDIIAEMRQNLSSGGRRHTKRNKQKRNKRRQNKKTKKRN